MVMTAEKPPIQVAESLATSIMELRQKRFEERANQPPWKPRRHYASSLNGCARQMVYAITHWEQKEKFPTSAIAAMEDGNHEEKLITRELLDDGFEIIEQQVQLDDDRYWITGKIDGKIKWQGRKVPFEVKRIQPFVFEKIDTVDDMKRDPFMLKYVRQLTLYLFLHSEEAGLFILSNGIGGRKIIVVPLDLGFAEAILKDLDTANKHLKAKTLPDRITYSSKVCGYCSFRKVCLPDMNFGEGAVLGETELAVAVARLQEIKAFASESERLKKEIKAAVEGKPIVIVGDYVVEGKYVERNIKAQEAKPARVDKYWSWDVEPLKKEGAA